MKETIQPRRRVSRRLIVLVLALLVVSGVAALIAPLVGRPRLVSITPANGAADANPQSAITLQFDQWVRPDSVQAAVKLDPAVPFDVVAPRWSYRGATTVQIRPHGGLQYNTRYRLTLDSTVRNLIGRTLDQATDVAWTTLPFNIVKQFGPAQDAAQVSLRAPLTVEFGAPVVSAEQVQAASQNPALADQLPQPLVLEPAVQGIGRWLSSTIYGFYPADGLHAATNYVATIRADLAPHGSAHLQQPVTWRFQTEAPLLVGTRPFDGAGNIAPDAPVEVRLAHDVDAKGAASLFAVYKVGDQTPVAGTVEAGTERLVWKPTAPLAHGARYEARLAAGAKSATGAALNNQPVAWSFTVIGNPEVAQVEPLADAAEVLTDTHRLSVRFNHPIVALTSASDQTKLPQPLTITPALPGSGKWVDTSTYVYAPTTALNPATAYTIKVAAGLNDQTGGTLQGEYSWTFRTITPLVLDSTPQPDAQFVGPNGPLQIVFNQPMDLASLHGAITLRGDDGVKVAGTVATQGNTAKGNVITFTPATALERGGSYVLRVAQSAKGAAGPATLSKAYEARFRVAPLPQLLRSRPANGESAAVPGDGVTLTWSTPMDWASVERNLVIEPKPTQVYTSSGETEFSISFGTRPQSEYRVLIGGAARDAWGVPLGDDVSVQFRTGDVPAAFGFVGVYQIGTYNAYVPVRVPVRHVGVPAVTYSLYRIDPTDATRLVTNGDAWQAFEPSKTAFAKDGTITLPGDRNEQRIDSLDLGQLKAGVYYLKARGNADLVDRQILVVSPYALTIKRSANQLFVWAVDLQTGQPVGDLPLTAQAVNPPTDKEEQATIAEPSDAGRTGGDGVAQTAFTTRDPYAPVFVWSPGERFAWSTTQWSEGIGPWDFGVPGDAAGRSSAANVYTDRPLYRPMQTVYLRGAVRLSKDDKYVLPAADQQVLVAINDPNGNSIMSTTLTLSPFGTWNTKLVLDKSAPLGGWSVNVSQPPTPGQPSSSPIQAYGTFSVAEYRKPVFEMTITPSKADVVQGDKLQMDVAARYFSGGAVANAPVRWRLLADPLYFSSESAPNFTFQSYDDAYTWYHADQQTSFGGAELVSEGTGKTDAQGHFVLPVPADVGKDNTSRRLTLDVEVSDVDGQVIAGQGTAHVHAGAFYVGLRPEGYVAQVGQGQKVSLLTLDPKEQPVSNRALSIKIYKREWFSVREKGPDGRLYWTSRFTDTLSDTQGATTDAQGRGAIMFTPKDGGSYRIEATGRDDGGHTIKASVFSWAYGGDTFWGLNDTNRIDLIADKNAYKPGDTAHILVPTPYKGMTALMTIERGQVLEHRIVTLPTTSEVLDIPLTADYAPNVYLSLVLVKPADKELPTPELRVGLINLPISTEQQELTIAVTPDKQEAGPRDTVNYTIKTTDAQGKGVPAEVGLALVDKAVLTLADDPNPSLKQAFYEKRPLGVMTSQSLTVLVDRVRLKLQAGDKGGGGGDAGAGFVRSNLPDTAYWNPSVVTSADGTAQISVTLPDNLTTWRMSARGLTTDTQVGQATQDLVATRPLLIRPTLPRFLTVGDQLTLQAVVQNNTAQAINATVALDPGSLGIDAPTLQNVAVPANGQVVVRWPAKVTKEGETRLQFTVKGGGLEDAVEQKLPIQRYTTPEVVATAGQVGQTPVIEKLQLPANAAQATDAGTTQGQVDVELVPSLAAGIETGLGYLEAYPYDCSEQSVSRFLPNAVSYRLLKQLGNDEPQLKALLERNLAAGLQRLYTLQHLDGGWGWWENDDSNAYLTAYVIQGLTEARKAGYTVEPSVFDNGVNFLLKALDGDEFSFKKDRWRGNARAYTLFVLAEAGRADRGRSVALYDERAKLDIYGRAYLLMTLKTLGDQDERVRTLVADLMSTAIMHATDAHWEERAPDYWTLNTDTRTTALALQALVRVDPNNFLVPNAVRYLMTLRDHGHWSTTQESAITLLALTEYLAQSGELNADYAYRVALDGRELKAGAIKRDNPKDPINLVIALADLKAGGSELAFDRQANGAQKGRLYYTVRTRSYQNAADIQPLDQGVAVQREYVAVDTVTLSPTGQLIQSAKLGDVVQVRLTLNVPENMRYFAVEDMLPAGLEALDTSLKTVTRAANSPALNAANADEPYWSYWGQTEVRDNRVALFATDLPKGTYTYTYLARATTAGVFQTLPTTAYQMYAPDVFGRSAGTKFEVTAP